MPLARIMGCSITANDKDQVSDFEHRVVLTDATGDAELVVCYGAELGHGLLSKLICSVRPATLILLMLPKSGVFEHKHYIPRKLKGVHREQFHNCIKPLARQA